MIPRLVIPYTGDVRAKLARLVGAAKSDEYVGQALKAGAEIYGREIQISMPRSSGRKRKGVHIQDAVKKGVRGRMTPNGPVYFSAIDRKTAPQARFFHLGTKHQKARPEVFSGAVARARSSAKNAVISELVRIQWEDV